MYPVTGVMIHFERTCCACWYYVISGGYLGEDIGEGMNKGLSVGESDHFTNVVYYDLLWKPLICFPPRQGHGPQRQRQSIRCDCEGIGRSPSFLRKLYVTIDIPVHISFRCTHHQPIATHLRPSRDAAIYGTNMAPRFSKQSSMFTAWIVASSWNSPDIGEISSLRHILTSGSGMKGGLFSTSLCQLALRDTSSKLYRVTSMFNMLLYFGVRSRTFRKKEWKAEREDVIALADVLQLSRLWQVDKLYWSCLEGLKRTFPSNLASYEVISMPPKFPTMASRFHVANVLREENILDLLPGALLLCCTSFTKLTDGCAELTPEGETVQLSAENMEAVSSGRARLKQYADACREPSDRCQYFPVRCYAALKSNAFEDPPCPYCIASWFWSPKSEGTRNPAWNEMCSIFD